MAAIDTHAATALRPADDAGVALELDTPPPAAPIAPPDISWVPPVTAYAPSGAPFAAPSAAVYAGGIDATPTAPPMPVGPAEDKLELDLDVDLEPATEVLDWDTQDIAASESAAAEPAAWHDDDSAPVALPASHAGAEPGIGGDDAMHTLAEPDPFAAFTLDDAFQLDPVEVIDAAPALEFEAEGAPASDTLADGRREPTWDEPAETPETMTAAAPVPAAEPTVLLDAEDEDEVLVDLSPAARARTEAPLPLTASRSDNEPTLNAPSAADRPANADSDAEEPGFVKRHHRRQRLGKLATIVMSLGSVLLVGALVGQAATTFRNQLAANVPQLKPALQTLCAALGCKVELPAQIDYVTIEQGELQTLNPSTFSFTTLLRNQATTAQAWPDIELRLDDANDKAVLRRVFTPRDYLGPDADLAKGFAPHSEQSVKLYFELRQLKASGYHIAVFYP